MELNALLGWQRRRTGTCGSPYGWSQMLAPTSNIWKSLTDPNVAYWCDVCQKKLVLRLGAILIHISESGLFTRRVQNCHI